MCLWKRRFTTVFYWEVKFQVRISRDTSWPPIDIFSILRQQQFQRTSPSIIAWVSTCSHSLWEPSIFKKDQASDGLDTLKKLFSSRFLNQLLNHQDHRKEMPSHLRNKQCFFCIFQQYLLPKECISAWHHIVFCVLFQLFFTGVEKISAFPMAQDFLYYY